MSQSNLLIGMNGRFFANNWRPALQEMIFAKQNRFSAIQFQGKEDGLRAEHLGASLAEIGARLKEHNLTAVMEILLWINEQGKSASGKTASEVLESNLAAIKALGCSCVHFHFLPSPQVSETDLQKLEQTLLPQLGQAASIATQEAFKFGFENNEPDIGLFATPDACAHALKSVAHLGFVWDINHTLPKHVESFQKLIPRMTMLHVADTPLPEVNHHLPLGRGNIDFPAFCELLHQGSFRGPAILEIGGLHKSGGYGKDTDGALIESLRLLESANRFFG